MQEYVVDIETIIPFNALNRYDGSNMQGARISIKKISDGLWWDGNSWEAAISYLDMDYIEYGGHEYTMTFDESGDYYFLFSCVDDAMITDSYVQTVFSERRIVISDIANSLRGSGATEKAVTVEVDSTPVADADVWITSDSTGLNIVAGTMQTDSQGNVVFYLDEGVTYYVWIQKDGYNFNNPEEVVW